MSNSEAALRDDSPKRSLSLSSVPVSANPSGTARLIFVPTPIGNLGDLTKRSIQAFESCDAIYCEDTRVTGKLLSALGIKKPLFRMDENSITEHADELIEKVQGGQTICFCSDAGMPAISDPGCRIVSVARKAGVQIEVLPGANAALVALVQSGFDSLHFYFEGFLPKKPGAKKERISQIMKMDCPVIIYESPNRVEATLEQIEEVDADRRVCIARELTKIHEEVIIEKVSNVPKLTQKGEFVLIIDKGSCDSNSLTINQELIEDYVQTACMRGVSNKDVCSDLQKYFGLTRNDSYKLVNLN